MKITELDRKEFPYHTNAAIIGIKRIRMIPSKCLLECLKYDRVKFYKLQNKIGPSTNPNWVTGRIAETLYDRGDIDETEFDYFTRDN